MIPQLLKYNNLFSFEEVRIILNGHSGFLTGLNSTPEKFLFYSFIIAVLVYLVVKSQSIGLIRTKRALKAKEEMLEQVERRKDELEQKEKKVTESLTYAQKIQEAMLPSQDYFRTHFRDSFILYRPRDIVSGDFYWLSEKGDKIFLVAADCTGHGVPGALMSVLGIELLNKTINDDNIEDTSQILGILNKALEKTFSREKNIGTIIRDGMDIGICVIDKKKRKIEFSGAFFPMYLIRDDSLTEFKGDKLIMGMNPNSLPYSRNEIDIRDNDILYFFSDGYADQFGGTENKKFMYRRFRYLLMTIHKFPVNDQRSILEDNIRTWMGSNPQVDDIMVIGFRPLANGG